MCWIAGHDGNLPKQRSEDAYERSLATSYKDLKSRQAGPIRGGAKPSVKKLTLEESHCFAQIGEALERWAGQDAADVEQAVEQVSSTSPAVSHKRPLGSTAVEQNAGNAACADHFTTPLKKQKVDGIGSPSLPEPSPAMGLQGLSPAAASQLAQSSRKSPHVLTGCPEARQPDDTPPLEKSWKTPAALAQHDPTEFENNLLAAASPSVQALYRHVRQDCARTGEADCLPHRRDERKMYLGQLSFSVVVIITLHGLLFQVLM